MGGEPEPSGKNAHLSPQQGSGSQCRWIHSGLAGGELAVGTILPLSFVFDHRVCDGAYAVRFLNTFMDLVTQPIRIFDHPLGNQIFL